MIPDDGVTVQEILHHADLAMYRAKEQGRSALVFFDTFREDTRNARLVAGN
jgi:predicted signal transduction protein with EAL and GGDEF domain